MKGKRNAEIYEASELYCLLCCQGKFHFTLWVLNSSNSGKNETGLLSYLFSVNSFEKNDHLVITTGSL